MHTQKAAIYLRVSTEDQSTDMQLVDLSLLAKLKGLEVHEVYKDHGLSGTNTKRPALQKLRLDLKSNEFNHVLVWKFDRISRSLSDLITIIKEFELHKVSLLSHKDNIDFSTPQGRLMLHMVGAFAEFEASMIRQRVQAGINYAKLHGTRSGKPFGRLRTRNDAEIQNLKNLGKNQSEIAFCLGIDKSTVSRALKGYQDENTNGVGVR